MKTKKEIEEEIVFLKNRLSEDDRYDWMYKERINALNWVIEEKKENN